uniref:Uncharacterized protein n=1 Tax=Alexandrium monilatum TaxID=311494 RepID=A0A7S4QMM2_9DINO
MAAQVVCQSPGQNDFQAEACWTVPEEASEPIRTSDGQKLSWAIRKGGGEFDDNSTELASTEGGSDDESRSEDASPVVYPTFSVEETLVIFDWDDTLLPTTWLRQHGYSLHGGPIRNPEHWVLLQTLAASAAQALRVARQLGRVVIVTNAETGWVQLSCQRFLPTLVASLEGLSIVSARSTYESPAARLPVDWKRKAFAHQVRSYYGAPRDDRFWNVVVLGDSFHEQQALDYATYGVVTCHAKFVKFAERPALKELIAEHQEVSLCLRRIVDFDGDLDVRTPGLELQPGSGELASTFDAGCKYGL